MPKTANDMMKEVCQLSLQNEFKRIAKLNISNIKYQSLSSGQAQQLARKIALLPSEYRNILLFHYCFNSIPNEIDKVLEIENAISKLPYVQKMLSGLMGLEDLWIDEGSMQKASQIVLTEMAKDYENVEVLHRPDYSKEFRQKLKTIKIKRNPKRMLMLMAKRAAVFILVCILSISAALVVNVEAREKMLGWIIQVYPEFNIFIQQNINDDNDLVKLTDLRINYIPEGFELMDIHQGRKMLIYDYLSVDNKVLTIKFSDPSSEGKSYYDIEGVEIEEIMFKGSEAYTWETDVMTYFLWHQDGIECHISGNLNKEEIIRVAENISK
ncbi:MAG TPA: DUF4367 domain-containing protein [Epulopiscium sp.]|nr:DUF4367 domain-containing protein [Candidatus Epulonipiscium sp.]